MLRYNNVSEYINEKTNLSFAPVNLFPIGHVYGKTLYSSIKLKEEYKELVKGSKLLDPVRDNIVKLIDEWKIVPCYVSSGLIGFVINKFSSNLPFVSNDIVTAFYHPKDNKVYSMFEEQISTLMNIDDRFCSFVLLHELQHYCAKNLKQKHFSLFSKMYENWYKNFFNYYFKTNSIKDTDVRDLALFLAINGDWTDDLFKDIKNWFKEYYSIIYKLSDKYNLDKKRVQDFFITIRLVLLNMEQYKSDIESDTEPSFSLFASSLLAYRKIGYKVNTLPYQELLYPSEIASMTCTIDKVQPIHYKTIQMLG